MSEETELETQVQIQAYNLVDFVIAIANHARIGYEPNIESNDGYPQMYGPGFFTCGMIRKQTVTDVTVTDVEVKPATASDDATTTTKEEPSATTADTTANTPAEETADAPAETTESTEQLKTTKQNRKFTPKLN